MVGTISFHVQSTFSFLLHHKAASKLDNQLLYPQIKYISIAEYSHIRLKSHKVSVLIGEPKPAERIEALVFYLRCYVTLQVTNL